MTVPARATMMPAARQVCAYFAPVVRATSAPALFNLARSGMFSLDVPPAGWISLGWIENFVRTPGTRIQRVRGGLSGAIAAQFRSQVEARVAFDFRDWGKLQMALAGGCQHLNVLAADLTADPSGATPFAPVAIGIGSTATELLLGAEALASFSAGDLIAVDVAYGGELGYVGTGVPGAFVRDAADIGGDPHFIRRITFNVARVGSKTATSLLLAQPLIAGAPPTGAQAQKICGFADREGGSFFQEWSAIFVLPEELGGRVLFYYPRLQPSVPAQEKIELVESPVRALALHAEFTALPWQDPLDDEAVACYRAYFPATSAAIY